MKFLLLGVFLMLTVSASFGQATRTWVSGVGDDVNPCSRTAPCKTFAGAISKTAAGGEINCLDPGGMGTVTVTKALTIDCTGTFGSILATGGANGVTINIPESEARRTVRLRGLAVNGAGTGLTGIRLVAAGNVTVENVVIDGFSQGISNESTGSILIANSSIRGNGTGVSVSAKGTVRLTRDIIVDNATPIANKGGTVMSYKDNVLDGSASASSVPAQFQ
jgi:hypothetical protein